MKDRRPFLLSLLTLALFARVNAYGITGTVNEASGITRQGDHLLIVGDEDTGVYYRFPLLDGHGALIPIDPGRLARVALPGAKLAIDLEAIDVLADGRVAVLSERLRALVGEQGLITEYANPLSEFGNRGLEGLAVRTLAQGTSRVAVLWEGGYPEYNALPVQLQRHVGRLPLQPMIWAHDLKAGEAGIEIKMAERERYALQEIKLDVPKPLGLEPQAQRFRAPDLVWYKTGLDCGVKQSWGFIVLLSSQNSPVDGKPEYRHQWLQRFTADGRPLGRALDLNRVIPTHLKGANWEGLAWFEEGKSLVIIHDIPPKASPTAVIVSLPDDWKYGETCSHPGSRIPS